MLSARALLCLPPPMPTERLVPASASYSLYWVGHIENCFAMIDQI
jgi:hypothetical protein